MKKIILIFIIPCLILFKLIFTFTTNEIIISKYNNGEYKTGLINYLYFINYPESYIVYYNHGNLLYKDKEYNNAIQKYETSLEKNPPQSKVCDIRINLSLAMVAAIDESNPEEALKILKKARETLYEDNCANEQDNSGESETAEKLEEEIKELEKKTSGEDSGEEEQKDPSNPNQEQKEENNKEKEIEKELENIQRDANNKRQESIEREDNFKEYEYNNGKRW